GTAARARVRHRQSLAVRVNRSRVPALVGIAVALTGAAGFRLTPDSYLYARRGLHLWPSPLGGLAGTIDGMHGVILMSAVAAYLLVRQLEGRARAVLVITCAYWLAFPGVDALGALCVVLLVQRREPAWLAIGALAHPVVALVAWPLAWRRDGLGYALSAACTAVT